MIATQTLQPGNHVPNFELFKTDYTFCLFPLNVTLALASLLVSFPAGRPGVLFTRFPHNHPATTSISSCTHYSRRVRGSGWSIGGRRRGLNGTNAGLNVLLSCVLASVWIHGRKWVRANWTVVCLLKAWARWRVLTTTPGVLWRVIGRRGVVWRLATAGRKGTRRRCRRVVVMGWRRSLVVHVC